MESFSRPPRHGSSQCADPEASWGHRNSNLPGPKGEMFFGYYLSAATMTRDEDGPAVPELTRRITLSSCHADPVRALAPVLARMPADGIALGDILADSGYAHRDAAAWALPLARRRRAAGPGPAPARPRPPGHHPRRDHRQREPLLPRHPPAAAAPGPARPRRHRRRHHRARHPHRRTRPPQARPAHRRRRRRLPPRHLPRRHGQAPLPAPARLDDPATGTGPEILTPPEHPPACCTQQTLTVGPDVAAKTRVAVGTALAGGPPHRSQRAGLPHWAPTSGA